MVKKRKNKRNKFARMSEEERARYMQHRAEFELETKRRKQQLIAIFTKNKLKREEAFSRLNIVKINEKWRCVLRQIKCKELYDDVGYLCETFDRVVKLKDETIHCLHNELKIADEDHRRLQEAHTVLIDNIIGLYKKKFKNMRNIYKLNEIKFNNLSALHLLKNYMRKDCKKIQYNINAKNKTLSKEQSVIKIRNVVNIRNILYLEEDMASNFEYQSSMKMENLCKQQNEIINEYEKMTENKRKQYEYLKEQDNNHQLCMLQYPKLHLQLQNVIKSSKRDIEILSLKREERIVKLKAQDMNMKERVKNIKHQFTATRVADSLQLKKLTVISNDILKNLQRIIEKGHMIFEIIKVCSPLEPLFFHIKEYFMQTAMSEFQCNVSESCNKIYKFWEQYNHMKADNILLKKESEKLYSENKKLKHKLQAYLITVSGVSVLQPVTLTIV